MEVIKQTKIGATPAPPSNPSTPVNPAPAPETEDDLLLKLATPFDSILYFLWGCHHLKKDIKVPVMMNLQDDDTLQWEKTIQISLLDQIILDIIRPKEYIHM